MLQPPPDYTRVDVFNRNGVHAPSPQIFRAEVVLTITQGAREGTHVKGQLFFRTSSRPKIKDREVVKHEKGAPSGSSAYITARDFAGRRWPPASMKLAERGLLDLGPMELARCFSGGGLGFAAGDGHYREM